jgi:hypothetical protein
MNKIAIVSRLYGHPVDYDRVVNPAKNGKNNSQRTLNVSICNF